MLRKPVIAEGLYSFEIGGSERVGTELAIQFRERGYDVVCFALYGSDGPFRELLRQRGIRCVDLNYTTRPRVIRRATFQAEVWRFLRAEGVSALHLHHASSLILCGIAAKLAGVPRTLVTEHSVFQYREGAAHRRSAARYCRFADDITVVSPDQLEYFHNEMGVPRMRLHCVPNGVRIRARNAGSAAQIRSEFQIAGDAFLFLYVGRLNEVKSLSTLVRGVALWPPEIRLRARVIIAGDGPERAMLQELSSALGLSEIITFAGVRSDVDELLSAADGFVMTSRTEGLPMGLLEAMGASVPCVATAVGGIPELLKGGAGLLLPAGSAADFSAATQRLATEPELRAGIVRIALARVERQYSLDAVVTRYLELLGLPESW